MLLPNAKSARAYSTDAENKKSGVRIGSFAFCLLNSPANRSSEPLEPQPIAAKNQPRAVWRSSLLFHEERKIAWSVAEITTKTKYNVLVFTIPPSQPLIASLL